jgi:cob(I)alamin adenosyltransferase
VVLSEGVHAITLTATDDVLAAGFLLPYLNRLADLLWILARVAERSEARPSTTARRAGARGRTSSTSPERSEA